jgi:thymidylate synthase-like protein
MLQATSSDALNAYAQILENFGTHIQKHNHNHEIQDLILKIPLAFNSTSRLRSFLNFLFEVEPLRLGKGLRKAERAYCRTGDRITKPSYIKRIHSFPDFSRKTQRISKIDQIRSVARGFCDEPNASYHVISIFRPVDLLDKFRPGYVPCVISADFKYRARRLNGKFFFRSCDAYNLMPFDMFYCVGIMEQLFEQIIMNHFRGELELGSILFWFSRIYISRFDIGQRQSMLDFIGRYLAETQYERVCGVDTHGAEVMRRSPSVVVD